MIFFLCELSKEPGGGCHLHTLSNTYEAWQQEAGIVFLPGMSYLALIYDKFQSQAKRTTLENSKETGRMDPSFRRRCPCREQTLE